MMQFLISPAQHSHLEQLNDLMFELHHEHHLRDPKLFKTAQEIEQEKSIARYLDDPECLVFVAHVDETIVGFITGHFCELVSTVSQPVQMGSIDELYIQPDFRHNGIAKQLAMKLEARFEEYGVKEVFVEVWDSNEDAMQFYQQYGFDKHIHWLRKPISK
ncbi:GNAT family N-acetyltransferase [Vibrio sinensis]|uniref:GNAT family N-acetyltransferase n=1 Tax=Vibrio sinensis TaxID=2302434 RepID=A0A3A6QWK4_9VIBR|nr:GNAT family N-acetyltransferase [Vibrio sinensis]RJX72859.1 GNAT family N-acetyltransferase [Vibrio sinensis]